MPYDDFFNEESDDSSEVTFDFGSIGSQLNPEEIALGDFAGCCWSQDDDSSSTSPFAVDDEDE